MTGAGVERATTTRAALLEAAREVFADAGFNAASIADVVRRAGGSVGGLYHHFGGKADIFLALYEDYQSRQERLAASAVRAARETGVDSPAALFLVGSRAFLERCWEERALARLFLVGEGPPGFDLVRRRRFREWVEANARLLHVSGEPFAQALTFVLTTVINEAGAEVAMQSNRRTAMRFAEEVLALVGRILDTV